MNFTRTTRQALSSAYLKPWEDKTRAFLMIAMLPGLFASGLQVLALAYHVAGLGATDATIFHFGRMLLMGLAVIPFCFWLLSLKKGKWIIALLQMIGTILFLGNPDSVFVAGLAYVLTSGPFWALFGQRNALALSQENNGNEVALLNYLQIIVTAAGNFCGGLFLEIGYYQPALAVSGLLLVLPTLLCVHQLPREKLFEKARALFGWRRPAVRFSFLTAILFVLTDSVLPTWMRLIGLSPLSTGTTMALRPILGTILTPAAGYLIQKGGLGAGRTGGLALGLGWIVLFFVPQHTYLLLPVMAFLTVGLGLIQPLEVNRWFKRRYSGAIIAREWALAAGRSFSYPLLLPLTFLLPPLVPFMGIACALLFVFGSKKRQPLK